MLYGIKLCIENPNAVKFTFSFYESFRREIMALQSENLVLEKQLHSYQMSLAKSSEKDAIIGKPEKQTSSAHSMGANASQDRRQSSERRSSLPEKTANPRKYDIPMPSDTITDNLKAVAPVGKNKHGTVPEKSSNTKYSTLPDHYAYLREKPNGKNVFAVEKSGLNNDIKSPVGERKTPKSEKTSASDKYSGMTADKYGISADRSLQTLDKYSTQERPVSDKYSSYSVSSYAGDKKSAAAFNKYNEPIPTTTMKGGSVTDRASSRKEPVFDKYENVSGPLSPSLDKHVVSDKSYESTDRYVAPEKPYANVDKRISQPDKKTTQREKGSSQGKQKTSYDKYNTRADQYGLPEDKYPAQNDAYSPQKERYNKTAEKLNSSPEKHNVNYDRYGQVDKYGHADATSANKYGVPTSPTVDKYSSSTYKFATATDKYASQSDKRNADSDKFESYPNYGGKYASNTDKYADHVDAQYVGGDPYAGTPDRKASNAERYDSQPDKYRPHDSPRPASHDDRRSSKDESKRGSRRGSRERGYDRDTSGSGDRMSYRYR